MPGKRKTYKFSVRSVVASSRRTDNTPCVTLYGVVTNGPDQGRELFAEMSVDSARSLVEGISSAAASVYVREEIAIVRSELVRKGMVYHRFREGGKLTLCCLREIRSLGENDVITTRDSLVTCQEKRMLCDICGKEASRFKDIESGKYVCGNCLGRESKDSGCNTCKGMLAGWCRDCGSFLSSSGQEEKPCEVCGNETAIWEDRMGKKICGGCASGISKERFYLEKLPVYDKVMKRLEEEEEKGADRATTELEATYRVEEKINVTAENPVVHEGVPFGSKTTCCGKNVSELPKQDVVQLPGSPLWTGTTCTDAAGIGSPIEGTPSAFAKLCGNCEHVMHEGVVCRESLDADADAGFYCPCTGEGKVPPPPPSHADPELIAYIEEKDK